MTNLTDEIKSFEKSIHQSIDELKLSYERYNRLVTNLIAVLDMEFTSTRALKLHILEILKASVNEK